MTCLFGQKCNVLHHCEDAPTTYGCDDPGCYRCGLGDFVTLQPFDLDAEGKPVVKAHHTIGHLIEGVGWVIDEQAGSEQIPLGCVIVKISGMAPVAWLYLHAYEHTQKELPEAIEITYWMPGERQLEMVTITRT